MRAGRYVLSGLAAFALVGAASLLVLRHRCQEAGGTFQWLPAACEFGRPIILQGDIHRV